MSAALSGRLATSVVPLNKRSMSPAMAALPSVDRVSNLTVMLGVLSLVSADTSSMTAALGGVRSRNRDCCAAMLTKSVAELIPLTAAVTLVWMASAVNDPLVT